MTSPVAKITDELEAKAAAFVKEHRLPGAAVGVVHGDDLVWSAGVGFADVASRRPPDTSTLYRIASITKTFTGTAIMQLRDEGRLHLDDPIVAYVPELRDAASPFGPIETVTIRRMLSHESGLAGDPPGHGLVDAAGLRGPDRAQPGPGRRDRHAHPAERATEVLEHRVPVARRGRGARDRRAVRGSRALGDPRAARHDEHPLRAGTGRGAPPPRHRVQRAVALRRAHPGRPVGHGLGRGWPVVVRRGPGAVDLVPAPRGRRTRATARRCWRAPP